MTRQRNRASVGYVRVSTQEQLNGHSVDAQRVSLSHCDVIVADPGFSSKSLNRPGMQDVLDRIRRGDVSKVYVTKVDRLSRSVKDIANIVALCAQKRTALVSLAENLDLTTAAGRMHLNALAMFAQFERERIGERVSDVMSYKRSKSEFCGRVPYGYARQDDLLVEDPLEIATLKRILKAYRAGVTCYGIAKQLRDENVPSRSQWWTSTVRQIVAAKTNAALLKA